MEKGGSFKGKKLSEDKGAWKTKDEPKGVTNSDAQGAKPQTFAQKQAGTIRVFESGGLD